MANVKTREVVVRDAAGVALVARTATLKNNATGATVTSVATDANGKASFLNQNEALDYRVEVAAGGSSSQIYANGPSSPEVDHLYVNKSLRVRTGTQIVLGGPVTMESTLGVADGISVDNGGIYTTGLGSFDGGLGVAGGAVQVTAGGQTTFSSSVDVGSTLTMNGGTLFLKDSWLEAIAANATGLTGGPHLLLRRSRGTQAVRAISLDNDEVGEISFYGWDGLNWGKSAAIRSSLNGTPALGKMPGHIGFWTSPAASANPAERVTIDSSGLLSANYGLKTSSIVGPLTITGQINTDGAIVTTAGMSCTGGLLAGSINTTNLVVTNGLAHGGNLGFYGAGTQPKPTVNGAKAGNAALTSLCAALATLGLITNSTT